MEIRFRIERDKIAQYKKFIDMCKKNNINHLMVIKKGVYDAINYAISNNEIKISN